MSGTFSSSSSNAHRQAIVPKRYLSMLVAIVIVSPFSVEAQNTPASQAEINPELRKQLISNWEARNTEIVSARLTYRKFSNNEMKPLHPDDVRQLFYATEFTRDRMALKGFVNAILAQPHPASEPWTDATFVTEGARTKEGNPHRTQVFDGTDTLVEDKRNRKIMIGAEPGPVEYRYQLQDFRTTVPETLYGQLQSVTAENDGRLRVSFGMSSENPSVVAIVSSTTGLLLDSIDRSRPTYTQLILQSDHAVTPSGIEFPMVRGRFRFRSDNTLESAIVTVVSDFDINIAVDDEEFVLPTRNSPRVQDFREGAKREYSAPQTAKDVKEFVEVVKASPAPATGPPPTSKSWAFILIGNICFISMLLIGLWLRRRSSK